MNSIYEQFKGIDEILGNAKKVLIASHQNPDPDAVCSVLAIHYVLQGKNMDSLPYLPDRPAQSLDFLPKFSDLRTEIGSFEPDVVFCLDYGDFKRLRLPADFSERYARRIITIDHHLISDQRGEVKVLEPQFSSTSEIIYYWLKYKNIEINKDLATLLLTGIFSDSGGFCHVSTTPEMLNIVSELLLTGASLNKIAKNTLDFSKPLNLSRAWGQVLSRARVDESTGLAYSWLAPDDLQRYGATLADFEGITNIIAAVSNLNLGLFLVEYEKGKIKGSLRSEPNAGRNVAELVKPLGGGGHPYAAGFNQEGTIDGVLKKVIDLIK